MARQTSLPAPWTDLARAAGGVERLADLCGASAMSVWRWAHEKSTPPETVLAILSKFAKDHRIKVPAHWGAARRRARLDVSEEYRAWVGILGRCYDTRHPRYAEWGGVGLSVCQRWRESFQSFLDDLGERPSPKHTLQFIDESRGFECGGDDCSDCADRGVIEPNATWSLPSARAARG